MNTFFLRAKNTSESIVCTVPFTDLLIEDPSEGGGQETITTIGVNISVYSGTDPNPSNVLVGSPSTDPTNTMAIFTLTGGVVGVIYIISVVVTGSDGTVAQKDAFLSIVATDPY